MVIRFIILCIAVKSLDTIGVASTTSTTTVNSTACLWTTPLEPDGKVAKFTSLISIENASLFAREEYIQAVIENSGGSVGNVDVLSVSFKVEVGYTFDAEVSFNEVRKAVAAASDVFEDSVVISAASSELSSESGRRLTALQTLAVITTADAASSDVIKSNATAAAKLNVISSILASAGYIGISTTIHQEASQSVSVVTEVSSSSSSSDVDLYAILTAANEIALRSGGTAAALTDIMVMERITSASSRTTQSDDDETIVGMVIAISILSLLLVGAVSVGASFYVDTSKKKSELDEHIKERKPEPDEERKPEPDADARSAPILPSTSPERSESGGSKDGHWPARSVSAEDWSCAVARDGTIRLHNQPCAQASGTRQCLNSHALKEFVTTHPNFQCDVCRMKFPKATTMFSCRSCSYDVCRSCYQKPQEAETVSDVKDAELKAAVAKEIQELRDEIQNLKQLAADKDLEKSKQLATDTRKRDGDSGSTTASGSPPPAQTERRMAPSLAASTSDAPQSKPAAPTDANDVSTDTANTGIGVAKVRKYQRVGKRLNPLQGSTSSFDDQGRPNNMPREERIETSEAPPSHTDLRISRVSAWTDRDEHSVEIITDTGSLFGDDDEEEARVDRMVAATLPPPPIEIVDPRNRYDAMDAGRSIKKNSRTMAVDSEAARIRGSVFSRFSSDTNGNETALIRSSASSGDVPSLPIIDEGNRGMHSAVRKTRRIIRKKPIDIPPAFT